MLYVVIYLATMLILRQIELHAPRKTEALNIATHAEVVTIRKRQVLRYSRTLSHYLVPLIFVVKILS